MTVGPVVQGKTFGVGQPAAFYDRWYETRIDSVVVPGEDDFVYGHLLRVIRRHLKPGARLLDYGCGDGVVALYAAGLGCRTLGLDFSEPAVARARACANRHDLTLAQFDIKEFTASEIVGEFDVAVSIEVIEHVTDDFGLVKWLAGQLGSGGICILSTRLVDDPLHRLRKFLKGRDWVDDGDGHVRRYSRQDLEHLVREAGLDFVETLTAEGAVRTFCYKHRWGGRVFRLLTSWGGGRGLLDRLDRLTLRWLGPAQIIVVARKPEN